MIRTYEKNTVVKQIKNTSLRTYANNPAKSQNDYDNVKMTLLISRMTQLLVK